MNILERIGISSGASEEERDERGFYTIGLIFSILLTVASYGCVLIGVLPRPSALTLLIVLALGQVFVHLRIFLHIDLSTNKREDLQVLLFTILLLAIMGLGTLWVIADLDARMM